ncbi:SOS response-associated peptidase [Parasphingorhabdus flavimaris]|nr:SOS response-associated peptidase [Parasphingorhabdus flavimaris]
MCNLYRMTSTAAEMKKLFGEFEGSRSNIPSYDAIYPDQEAPVLTATGGRHSLVNMTWGVPGWKEGMRPITNVRNLTSNFWKNMLVDPQQRCLGPVTAFCEWTGKKGSKKKVWFGLKDEPLFSFAGIWRETHTGPRMAFLTCEPNSLVELVHPKAMPVILKPDDYGGWLSGGYDDAVSLAKPFDADAMEILE